MVEFIIYGQTFEESLENLENVPKCFKETNLTLNNEKFHFLLTRDIILSHHISLIGIKADLVNVQVIKDISTPRLQKQVCSFFVKFHYCYFTIDKFSKLASLLFSLLFKETKLLLMDEFQVACKVIKK